MLMLGRPEVAALGRGGRRQRAAGGDVDGKVVLMAISTVRVLAAVLLVVQMQC